MNNPNDPFIAPRIAMVEDQLRARDINSPRVLDAMLSVPRHLFVAPEIADRAYEDSALPSLSGQTISQPYIVAFMSQHLDPHPNQTILELGTGTGYQTAVLASLILPHGQIFTIERSPDLSHFAHTLLDRLQLTNIRYHIGDGSQGWPPSVDNPAPQFDRILITAATPRIPPPLLDQLKPGGLLLAPVGPADSQTLTLFRKSDRAITSTDLLPCRFVPLVGKHGFPEPDA